MLIYRHDVDEFLTTIEKKTGNPTDTTNVLDGSDETETLASGDKLQITGNDALINPKFTFMGLKLTVTGATSVVLKFYNETGHVIKEVTVSISIVTVSNTSN